MPGRYWYSIVMYIRHCAVYNVDCSIHELYGSLCKYTFIMNLQIQQELKKKDAENERLRAENELAKKEEKEKLKMVLGHLCVHYATSL